jgi:hypothetical protein
MELERIFLARFAEITPDGHFTAVGGGLNRISVSRFPWSLGFLFLLIQYRLSAEEAGRPHVMAVERETPSGRTEPIRRLNWRVTFWRSQEQATPKV